MHRSNLHIHLVDLSKALDSVPRHALTNILKHSGIEDEVVRLIVDLDDGTGCVVQNRGNLITVRSNHRCLSRGCVLSPILFNLFMDRIMRETLDKARTDERLSSTKVVVEKQVT